MATKDAADAAKKTLNLYTVAPGRTVITDDGTSGPGEDVLLDDDEAKRFRELGFILAEDGTPVIRTDGPATVAGAEIVEKA